MLGVGPDGSDVVVADCVRDFGCYVGRLHFFCAGGVALVPAESFLALDFQETFRLADLLFLNKFYSGFVALFLGYCISDHALQEGQVLDPHLASIQVI